MKKTLSVIVLSLLALGASAQDKGRFEVYDLGDFKLHVYYTNDALGDASRETHHELSCRRDRQP